MTYASGMRKPQHLPLLFAETFPSDDFENKKKNYAMALKKESQSRFSKTARNLLIVSDNQKKKKEKRRRTLFMTL